MADYGNSTPAPAPADPRVHRSNDLATNSQPHSLRDALKDAARRNSSSASASTSEEDYDDKINKPVALLVQQNTKSGGNMKAVPMNSGQSTPSDASFDASVENVTVLKGAKVYTIAPDDKELRDILKKGLQRVSE